MSASRLQFGLLGTAVLLFLIALTFSNYYEHFERIGTLHLAPNIVAAAGLLGFSIAGGLALLAAAIVERSKPHWPGGAEKEVRQD
jgi:hypothetical protein